MAKDGFWERQAQLFGAEMAALGREGLKDFRSIVMGEWGKGVEEPGTIGNPTQMMVNEQFEVDAGYEDWLRTKSEAAYARPEKQPDREVGE